MKEDSPDYIAKRNQLASYEFDAVLPPDREPNKERFPPVTFQVFQAIWQLMSKNKAEVVEFIAQMSDEEYLWLNSGLQEVITDCKCDLEMAEAANLRMLSASAFLAVEEAAGRRSRS